MRKWMSKVLKRLERVDKHPAIPRNAFRFFQKCTPEEKYAATLFDIAVTYLTDGSQPGAVRAFAISTAANVCRQFPDLMEELKSTIDNISDGITPAMRHRIQKAVKLT